MYSFAQEQDDEQSFSLSGQIRSRAEYRNGAFFPRHQGTLPATFINNRARLSMDFKKSYLEFKMSAQHVSVWGEDPLVDRNGRMMMNEAWAKMYVGNGFFAQLGRQPLSYDDERLLSVIDWHVSGRYHDVLKLGYEDPLNKLHLILAYNQIEEKRSGGNFYMGEQPYKNMQTIWYHHGNNSTPFNISLLMINLGWEVGSPSLPESSYMQTWGTHLSYKPGHWNITGSLYGQTGKNDFDIKVSAFMGSIRLAYALNPAWSVWIASDYLSGQKNDSEKITSFNTLYGANHKFYGAMDYFYASPYLTSNPGLWDNQFGVLYKASDKVDMSLNYHYFSAINNKVRYSTAWIDIKKGLGSEFDFQINCTIMKDIRLIVGYSFMLGTESMNIIKGGDHKRWQDWGWISLNINPQLLFYRWR
ncbi:MAG: alginate export family protein [Bacteroidales bacterium]|nr:alginate export family protein [Bacteroidales bacterium]MCL2738132.1 alginate export family protein [Bacteroidales bacterium]